MSTTKQSSQLWESYPAGPAVRMYLGLSEQQADCDEPNHSETSKYEEFLAGYIERTPVRAVEELATLIDELYKMGFSRLALKIHEANASIDMGNQFHGLLSLGAAALIEGDVELAEGATLKAQELVPQEIAPYYNLALVYEKAEKDQQTIQWGLAGLEIEKNYEPLWHLVIRTNISKNIIEFEDLWIRAVDLGAWVGVAMLTDATALFEGKRSLAALRRIYDEGERGESFLVDYTARLGQAEDFNSINAVLWDLEKQKISNWMLLWHGYQARMAANDSASAREIGEVLLKRDDLPQDAKKVLQQDMFAPASN